MKAIAADHVRSKTSLGKRRSASSTSVPRYFDPIKGQSPWRVRLGVGSFLTFEFGSRIRANGHEHGEWHLWIYLSNWTLLHSDRELVNSDSDRHPISLAVRRLEGADFTGMEFDQKTSRTVFSFGDFQLIVTPADYLDSPDKRDQYWLFFMPHDIVLSVGPGGANARGNHLARVEQEPSLKRPKRAIDLNL
jgi:hypothetical protein